MTRARSVPLVAMACLLALTACSLPADDQASDVAPEDVPFELLAPASTTLPDNPEGTDTQNVSLYFQNDERLIAVPREIESQNGPVSPQVAITELLKGPDGLGAPAGVRSAIPSGTRLLGAQSRGDVVVLNLSETLSDVESSGLVFAIAQLVFTAAGIDDQHPDGTNRLLIQIDGKTISVPNDEGVELDRPVGPSDYDGVRPVASPAALP